MSHSSNLEVLLIDPCFGEMGSANVTVPLSVGLIGSYLKKQIPEINVTVLKKSTDILSFLDNKKPDILGICNYLWNTNLANRLSHYAREINPKTYIAFGGPEINQEPVDKKKFFQKYSHADMLIEGEGELAFANLVAELIRADMKKNNLKNEIPSVHYIMSDGNAQITSSAERIKDLTEIPSPYLEGKLDEFFDGKLQPVIQTTRGCPFACTFCVEGMSYYTKIYRNSQEKTNSELHYIGSKMQKVKSNGGRNDLWVVDSNFGMYSQDIDTCKIIAKCQEQYNWPDYIHCDTGKNNKERVLNAAKLVNGAIRLSGSVQSLNPDVLKNIKPGMTEFEAAELYKPIGIPLSCQIGRAHV